MHHTIVIPTLNLWKSYILKLNDLFEYQYLICMHDYLSGKLPNSFDGNEKMVF